MEATLEPVITKAVRQIGAGKEPHAEPMSTNGVDWEHMTDKGG